MHEPDSFDKAVSTSQVPSAASEQAERPVVGAAPTVLEQLLALRAVAWLYVHMIQGVEQRCMAADGPVTRTCDEITDEELRKVYVAALAALGAA